MFQHYRSLEAVSLRSSWLTIGVFDGVHRGHQEIIRQLTAGAHTNGAPAVVLTFSPHPALVLGGVELKWLTTPDERADILAGLGVDVVITYPFDKQTAALSPEEFMAQIKKHLDLQKLFVGYDFSLGRNRSGDVARLTEIGREMSYDVLPVAAVQLDGQILSSTLIRQQIKEGDVAAAASRLGRHYTLSGPVIRGDGRGRTIGIPTANIDVPLEKVIPANGVYACLALVGAEKHKTVVNIGVRPTFTSGEVVPRVEAHLLDFNADIYDQTLTLEFVERLRGEQKFPSIDALVAQIKSDIAKANDILA
jgi:riboflavin kinase/FMN adenylyltransferase